MPRRKKIQEQKPTSLLDKAKRVLQRASCQRSLWYFLTEVVGLHLDRDFHGPLVAQLQAGDFDEMLILAARGHYKTYIVAGYLAWRIACNRNVVTLNVGVNLMKGSQTVYLARQFLELDDVVAIFGPFDSELWAQESFTVRDRNAKPPIKDPSLYAMGIDAFRQGGHHDVIVFEDVEDHERVKSPDVLEQTRRTDGLAYPMADRPDAKRITVGTFYAVNDLYHHKLEQLGLYSEDEFGNPYLKRGVTKKGPNVLVFLPAENADGTFAFPRIEKETRKAKAKLSPYEYALQYKLDILGNEDAPFKKDDFVYRRGHPDDLWKPLLGIDAARSRKAGSDFCGIVDAGISKAGRLHVFEGQRVKLDGGQLIDLIIERVRLTPSVEIIIEEDGYVAGLRPQMEERFRRERLYPKITFVNAHARARKDDRILALQGMFRMHAITFERGRTEQVERDLLPFPGPGKRDLPDALANLLEIIQTPVGNIAAKRREEERARYTKETAWMRRLEADYEKKPSHVNHKGARIGWKEC